MKCHCGYEGIPTQHHEPPHYWKCPKCHAPRHTVTKATALTPETYHLVHDPMKDEDGNDFVCSQCGMRGPTESDLRTDCPGHGANWTHRILHCVCGEWAFAPSPPARTIICKRCGEEYPRYFRADYVPPDGDIVARAEKVMKELRRIITAAGKS